MDFNFDQRPKRKRRRLKYLSFLPKSLRQSGLYCVILNLLTVFLTLVFYPGLQEKIPLFYSLPPEQQLLNKESFFIIPILATLVNFLHFSLIKGFKDANQTVLKIFILATLVIQSLSLAIVLRTILILR